MTVNPKEGDNAFTGRILKVVVDGQPIAAAQKIQQDSSLHEANLKKAPSD